MVLGKIYQNNQKEPNKCVSQGFLSILETYFFISRFSLCLLCSFLRSLDLLKQILHLEVEIGLSFLGLFAEDLKVFHLFLFVPLNGFFSLLFVLQVLL